MSHYHPPKPKRKTYTEYVKHISIATMSVNEVKLKQAVDDFVVKGSGAPTSRTFCIGNEDHTLGNALRHVLVKNANVSFAGYSVPHPSEPIVQVRVQTMAQRGEAKAPTATQSLKTACNTLYRQCDIVLERLEDLLPEVKEDRLQIEKFQMEEGFKDEDESDEDENQEEPVGIKMEE